MALTSGGWGTRGPPVATGTDTRLRRSTESLVPRVLSYKCDCFLFTKSHGAFFWLQVMDGPGENDPDLKRAGHPRFCEEVKRDLPPYTQLFTRVFQNKTFHVYKLARDK